MPRNRKSFPYHAYNAITRDSALQIIEEVILSCSCCALHWFAAGVVEIVDRYFTLYSYSQAYLGLFDTLARWRSVELSLTSGNL